MQVSRLQNYVEREQSPSLFLKLGQYKPKSDMTIRRGNIVEPESVVHKHLAGSVISKQEAWRLVP